MNGIIEGLRSGGGPTKGAVLLFIGGLVMSILLVAGGTIFAVYSAQHQETTGNQQWCSALDLLTRTPVAKPANPAADPSREFAYQLYTDFVAIKDRFGCM